MGSIHRFLGAWRKSPSEPVAKACRNLDSAQERCQYAGSMLAVIGNLLAAAVASTLFAKTLYLNRR